MNPRLLTLLLTAGLLLTHPLRAADPTPESSPPTLPETKEMAALEHFLDLTDEDLDQMQQVIVRIRAMGPAERAALRREIEKFRSLPDTQRRQLRQGWGAMDRNLQEGWQRMMHAATPERRAEIHAQMQAQPPEGKNAFRRQLVEAFLRQEGKK